MENKKLELLKHIIYSSKEFQFEEDDILNIRKYYNTKVSININFSELIDICYEKLDEEDIDRFLLNDEELEGEF